MPVQFLFLIRTVLINMMYKCMCISMLYSKTTFLLGGSDGLFLWFKK